MKRLSEVCEIVGVTRRTLQGYDEIGVLHPTAKTAGGYWLYDEDAIKKLVFIQLFVELGYKRREIKDLLEKSASDIDKELNNATDLLLEKRKHIDGLLNMIKVMHITTQLSQSTLNKLEPFDLGKLLEQENYVECLRKNIAQLSNNDQDERREYEFFMQLTQHIIILCQLKKQPVDDPDVKTVVRSLIDFMIEVIFDILQEEGISDIKNKTIHQLLVELWDSIISEPELMEYFDRTYGDGSSAYVNKAFRYYITIDHEDL